MFLKIAMTVMVGCFLVSLYIALSCYLHAGKAEAAFWVGLSTLCLVLATWASP